MEVSEYEKFLNMKVAESGSIRIQTVSEYESVRYFQIYKQLLQLQIPF